MRLSHWINAWALLGVGLIAAGCHTTTTYDGSEKFYEQHPQYNDRPAYMDPSQPSDDPDVHANHPW